MNTGNTTLTDPGRDGPGPSAAVPSAAAGTPPAPRHASPRLRSRWRHTLLRLSVVGLAALVVGGAVGRLLTVGDGPADETVASPAIAEALLDEIAALERRVEEDPEDLGSLQKLGVAATRLAAETGDPARYAQAEEAFARAAAIAPEHHVNLIGKGNLALSRHEFALALDLGERALAAVPLNEAALLVVTDAQVELGAYEDAAATLQRLLDTSPGLPALARTSYLRELHGDMPGAIRAMQQSAIAGAGTSAASVTALLGDLHARTGDEAAASAAYARALELSPGLPTAVVGRARVLAATDRRDQAIAQLEALTASAPIPAALLLLADLQRIDGRAQAAEETDAVVRAVADLQAAAGQVVDLEMALFEADRGKGARAVALARQAYEVRPDNVFTADALAWALHRSGDTEAALPLVDQALRLGSVDPVVRYHAAVIAEAAGDLPAVVAHLDVALPGLAWAAPQHHAAARHLSARVAGS